MDNGDDLITGRTQFKKQGKWLSWLFEACSLQQRQALRYVTLAEHRPDVEAYLTRESNLGIEVSIRRALNFISPPAGKPKKPKKISEIEIPDILGAFLNEHCELFWKALPLAPKLKDEIAQQKLPKAANATDDASKVMAKAAAEARAIRQALRKDNPSSTNLEDACTKADRIVRLLDPTPASKSDVPSQAKLDVDALPKALGLRKAA
jgi:hypothetical protein